MILESLEKSEPILTIHYAKYGAAGRLVDVAPALKQHIVDGRLNVIAGSQLAGGPSPGVVKELTADYSHRDKRQTTPLKRVKVLPFPERCRR